MLTYRTHLCGPKVTYHLNNLFKWPGDPEWGGRHVGWEVRVTVDLKWTVLCREPAWGIPPMTRSCGKSSDGKANQTSGFPNKKNKNLLAFVLCFSTFLIFSGKKSTQGFSLLHLKGMFQLKPLWLLSSLPNRFPRPLTACELLTAPQLGEAQSLKAS